MAQPQWITPAGSLGTIAEGVFYQIPVRAEAGSEDVFFRLIAGSLPAGIQISESGIIEGVPNTIENVRGVPLEVARDTTSRFAIRAFTRSGQQVDRIADRTFTLTVSGQDLPAFVTPAGNIANFYDGTVVSLAIEFTDPDLDDEITVSLAGGELPPGLEITAQGVIQGEIIPLVGPPNTALPGYDDNPFTLYPYDFRTRATSRNYQFTVEITDGKQSNLRTFEIFVYAKDDMTADTVDFTADNTFITADVTPLRTPILLNPPGSIGIIRSDNFFAYQFLGQDFDGDDFEFELVLGNGQAYDSQGFSGDNQLYDRAALGIPTGALGLTFNNQTGWLSGYIPDQGATELTWPFAVRVFKTDQPQYQSPLSFFSLTVTPDVDSEVIWLTHSDLGFIDNGSVSLLEVQARAESGQAISYRLAPDSASQLPQGLTLQPSGHITGRVSFNTFALDGGTTVFDREINGNGQIQETTFDLGFEFTVNAFAPASESVTYRVNNIEVTDGGSGYTPFQLDEIIVEEGGVLYDALDPPTVTISPPPNLPFNRQATVASVTIASGSITAIAIDDPGFGYVAPPTITISGGAGVGAQARATIFTITVSLSAPPNVEGAEQATAGSVTVEDGVITAIAVGNPGSGYLTAPTVTITGGGGAGAAAVTTIAPSQLLYAVSSDRTFRLTLRRRFNQPYETLYIKCMPGFGDRELINDLVNDRDLIPDDKIYRADDPNFGRSRDVIYVHAYGLDSATMDQYVSSLYLNHYWRNITLGPFRTARALDSAGNVLYEVIYSEIIDDLLNNAGQSVGRQVTLPYPVPDPSDPLQEISTVYPASLPNMRDQVIDTVGQITPGLPLWMLSKQTNNQVLGFTPAWVVAYVEPGAANKILYDLNRELGFRLNVIDFKIDRYELDRSQTHLWDPEEESWIPTPPEAVSFDLNTQRLYPQPALNAVGNIIASTTQMAFGTDTEFTLTSSLPYDTVVVTVNGTPQTYAIEIAANFLGDGSTVIFVFADYRPALGSPTVIVDGVVQTPVVDYTFSAGAVTFVTAPDTGAVITVRQNRGSYYMTYTPSTITANFLVPPPGASQSTVADGSTEIFAFTPVADRGLYVTIDNVPQVRDQDYVVYTSSIRFTSPPEDGSTVRIQQPSLVSLFQLADVYTNDPNSTYGVETIFDGRATQFNSPADRWIPTDVYDKYLVFPKRTILG